MNSIFNYLPTHIKQLIYLFFISLGTPTSKIIKDEYYHIYCTNARYPIFNQDITYYIDKDIGFLGCKMTRLLFLNRTHHEKYTTLPPHVYDIDAAKLHYLYHYSNAPKTHIIHTIRSDLFDLLHLFKLYIFKLTQEEFTLHH